MPWPLGNSNKIYYQDLEYSKEPPLYAPRTQVLIKVWKIGSPNAQLQPTWKGPCPVIFSTPTAKYQDMTPGFTPHKSSPGRKQKRTLNIFVNKPQYGMPVQQGYIKLHPTMENITHP